MCGLVVSVTGVTLQYCENISYCRCAGVYAAQAYPGAGTPAYVFNWENSGPAVALLLARATDYKVLQATATCDSSHCIGWIQGACGCALNPKAWIPHSSLRYSFTHIWLQHGDQMPAWSCHGCR